MEYSQPAAPRSGRTWSTDPGQAANGERGSAHRRSLARHTRAIRQLEFGLCALHTLEQARRVGCRIRNLSKSWATSRRSLLTDDVRNACDQVAVHVGRSVIGNVRRRSA
jgi:hypothetical protein